MTPRPLRTLAVAAAGAASLLGVSACGSSSSSSAAPTTTVAPTTTTSTTTPPTTSALASQVDALCAEASTVRTDVSGLNLQSPQSLGAAAGTVTTDLSKLQADLSSVTNAGNSGAKSGPLQTLTDDVRQAVSAGQQAIEQFTAGKTAAAQGDAQQVLTDLQGATTAGKQAGLQCGSDASGTTTTSVGH